MKKIKRKGFVQPNPPLLGKRLVFAPNEKAIAETQRLIKKNFGRRKNCRGSSGIPTALGAIRQSEGDEMDNKPRPFAASYRPHRGYQGIET